jgi:hypothetical protein
VKAQERKTQEIARKSTASRSLTKGGEGDFGRRPLRQFRVSGRIHLFGESSPPDHVSRGVRCDLQRGRCSVTPDHGHATVRRGLNNRGRLDTANGSLAVIARGLQRRLRLFTSDHYSLDIR